MTKAFTTPTPVGTVHSQVPTVAKVRIVSPFDAVVVIGTQAAAFAAGAVMTAVGSEVKSPAKRAYVSHREICGRLGRRNFASIRKYLFY
jgi:hypothetical protein